MKYLFIFAILLFALAFINADLGDDVENAFEDAGNTLEDAGNKIKDKLTGSASSFALSGFLATAMTMFMLFWKSNFWFRIETNLKYKLLF